MSIPLEKLSLLDSLAPLRFPTENSSTGQDRGFAVSLEKALGGGEQSPSTASNKAREVAEALSLQMLHASISLAGTSATDSSSQAGAVPFASASAILNAYRGNIAADAELHAPASLQAAPSQLKDDVADVTAVEVKQTIPTRKYHSDTSWLDPIISKASSRYGVDSSLIRAVIKAESNFNPQAVSHAGARGLMQLMPATARSLGVTDSFDPEQNIMGGTRFLKDMLQRYNGDVDAALAAYNWGPGNVDKRPDHLPRETRDYLARVKQLYTSYNS